MPAESRSRRRHRSRRPDRLQPALPHRQRGPARPRPAGDPPAARDHAGPRRARRRGHGARGLRLPAARRHGADRRRGHAPSTASNVALLVGSRPRTKGMERADLLEANGAIFTVQGKALSDAAADDVKILVVGNPANTNALIAMNNAPKHRARALHGHDPPRPQPGHGPAGRQDRRAPSTTSRKMTIWGNHSATQYPDLFHAEVGGKNAAEVVGDQAWLEDDFIPTVQQRGAAIIEARGASTPRRRRPTRPIDHVRTWVAGTADGDWVSMAVPSRRQLRRARGPHVVVPVHDAGRARRRSSRASTSTTSPAPASTPASPSWPRSATPSRASASSDRYLRNLLVVLSARTLPPVWQVGQ